MTAAEIQEVEDLVNRYILQNEPVTTDLMKIEDAMRSGAVAMFGEKYGSEVRVLSVGDGMFFQRALRRHARASHGGYRQLQDHDRRSYCVRRATHQSDHRIRFL
jgi:alanyl-tRNA synthetase